jgi:flagellar motor switch protein FliG
LSDLVEFEDLGELDGGDLRAVLEQVGDDQVADALAGATPGLRHRLLTKLRADSASRLETRMHLRGPVPVAAARAAQQALVATLRRLSRGGQIAFDDPEDMVP